ncbi:MAG: hypothetical protein ABIG84_06955 [archaeon]
MLDRYEQEGITFYLDEEAKSLVEKYDPKEIHSMSGVTGNFVKESQLAIFPHVAQIFGKHYGLTNEGYNKAIDLVNSNKRQITFIANEKELNDLTVDGWLRIVEHEDEKVYFSSEELVKSVCRK